MSINNVKVNIVTISSNIKYFAYKISFLLIYKTCYIVY